MPAPLSADALMADALACWRHSRSHAAAACLSGSDHENCKLGDKIWVPVTLLFNTTLFASTDDGGRADTTCYTQAVNRQKVGGSGAGGATIESKAGEVE